MVEFWDWHHPYLAKHSLKRLSTYRAEGFKVVGTCPRAQDWVDNAKTGPKRAVKGLSSSNKGQGMVTYSHGSLSPEERMARIRKFTKGKK